jgi:hypothetical protein
LSVVGEADMMYPALLPSQARLLMFWMWFLACMGFSIAVIAAVGTQAVFILLLLPLQMLIQQIGELAKVLSNPFCSLVCGISVLK